MNHAQRLRDLAARTGLDGFAEDLRAMADEMEESQTGPDLAICPACHTAFNPRHEFVDSYQPGDWFHARSREELAAFFLSRLPAIRQAAHAHGYAIGVHGSLRRDMDLIATPWRDGSSDKDTLAHAIAMAACGIARKGPYQWEAKPMGRMATSISCCWTPWPHVAGSGQIDLSVTPAVVVQLPKDEAPELYTIDQIAEACAQVEVSDSKFESLSLYLATHRDGDLRGRGWRWHVTEYKPNVPEGMLRNLRPLVFGDPTPLPAEASLAMLDAGWGICGGDGHASAQPNRQKIEAAQARYAALIRAIR